MRISRLKGSYRSADSLSRTDIFGISLNHRSPPVMILGRVYNLIPCTLLARLDEDALCLARVRDHAARFLLGNQDRIPPPATCVYLGLLVEVVSFPSRLSSPRVMPLSISHLLCRQRSTGITESTLHLGYVQIGQRLRTRA